MKAPDRDQILVAGQRPVNWHSFAVRGLRETRVDLSTIDDPTLASARGILVAEVPGKFSQLSALLNGVFRRACALGVKSVYWPADAEGEARLRYFLKRIPNAGKKYSALDWIYLHKDLEKIAEVLRRHETGPGLGHATIRYLDERHTLSDFQACLLQRAFADAQDLVVEKLTGGRTAEAFRVHATLAGLERGPQPMPFVFKVGEPQKIEDEKENYRERATPFIPFHLRPGLDEVRCVTTPTGAALVCNFVDSATPLETALMNRQGAGVIFALFETTLRGLRAHTLASTPQVDAIHDFILERVKAARIRKDATTSARIGVAHGKQFVGQPEELEAELLRAACGMSARRGTYHGDLHVGNVMARQRDAIVIDFGSMTSIGPVTADPAFLEVSIVFGTRLGDAPSLQDEWFRFVDKLYEFPLDPPLPTADYIHFAWVGRAIRELRHVVHCCGVSPREALLVLAATLLRFAGLSPYDFEEKSLVILSEERRAYALVMAQRVHKLALKWPA
jgi:hypothetical protein